MAVAAPRRPAGPAVSPWPSAWPPRALVAPPRLLDGRHHWGPCRQPGVARSCRGAWPAPRRGSRRGAPSASAAPRPRGAGHCARAQARAAARARTGTGAGPRGPPSQDQPQAPPLLQPGIFCGCSSPLQPRPAARVRRARPSCAPPPRRVRRRAGGPALDRARRWCMSPRRGAVPMDAGRTSRKPRAAPRRSAPKRQRQRQRPGRRPPDPAPHPPSSAPEPRRRQTWRRQKRLQPPEPPTQPGRIAGSPQHR
mmetsp:Transcript_22866/g.58480  ORF Transcript_22866/g.58480 Transcript_22866/m.58480 type:complete len:252 (-) Transcript_22866:86-841(-)